MSQSIRTAGALALGALVVAVAALAVRPGAAVGAPTIDGEILHTITVSASGSVSLVPDVARVGVGVTVTKPTVKATRDAAGTAMNAIIAGLKALGIDEKDIRTTSIDLSPQYANGSSTKIVGYRMSEQLQVTVRDLDKAGDVIDTATAKGATDVNGLWFEVSDPDAATRPGPGRRRSRRPGRARRRWPRRRACRWARRLDRRVVGLVPDAVRLRRRGGPRHARPRSSPGTQDVQATVTVVFEID